MNSPDWNTAENLLCIRLDNMGDVLMMTPAIRALKSSHPERRITLLASPSGAAIAPLIPEIDDTIAYRAPWVKGSEPNAEQDAELLQLLRSRRFDGAVIFTTYSQSPLPAALLCYQAGIPLRLACCRENPYLLLTDWVKETEPSATIRHEVRRQLDLVAHIGCRPADEHMSLRISAEMRAIAGKRLRMLNIGPQDTWIVVHPGATAASRRYSPSHWREAIKLLSACLHCPIVFTGDKTEIGLIEDIRAGLPDCHSLAGTLDLGELAALILLAPLMISNNTGPAHIAAAVGTPIVDLYALTNPQHTPWLVPSRILFHDVPCRYCYKSACPEGHHDCLEKVEPATVADAALDLLHETGASQVSPNTLQALQN